MSMGNHIKEYRSRKSITQEALAKTVRVSRQTIIAIEKGNYVPSLLLAMYMANFFEVRVEDLFYIKP